MEPQIRYCTTSDGVSIAYTEAGEGIPIVVMAIPGLSHAELSWEMFAPVAQPLAARYRYITFDSRGSGLSDRSAIDFSIDALLRDLEAVVDRCELDSFVLATWLNGVPVAARYAATNPERVSHLVLSDGYASFSDFSESPAYRTAVPLLDAADWVVLTETFGNVLWAFDNPEYGRAAARYIRACMDREAFRASWKAVEDYDVTDYLPQISAPTLVVHNKNNRWFPIDVGRRLAAAIPQSRLVLIDDMPYGPLPGLISEFIEPAGQPPLRAAALADSAMRTILFTDVEGSTALTDRLGDAKARELLREHERTVREALKSHGGSEVKTMGDGFMASFGSVTKAVDCAIALQRAFADREGEPLSIRVGLNAGEPIEEEGDLFGATVILASRIAAKAEGGEILVSDNIRSLSAGKGFLFSDRGEFVAKGFEEPVRVYEVKWQHDG